MALILSRGRDRRRLRSASARALRAAALGGRAVARPGFVTDNGNVMLVVLGLDLSDPQDLELELDVIPGVVESGLFARRRADVVLVGTAAGVRRLSGPRTP
ncbi:MAG: ribose-5-phosphate isomerase A [Actinobacteria bacterium]|nr:ribose-5-phosphate isomerase A [Actinomycetota bacterium]